MCLWEEEWRQRNSYINTWGLLLKDPIIFDSSFYCLQWPYIASLEYQIIISHLIYQKRKIEMYSLQSKIWKNKTTSSQSLSHFSKWKHSFLNALQKKKKKNLGEGFFLFVLFFGLWFWTFTFYNAMWAGRGLTWIPRNPLSAVSKCCPWL